MNVSKLSRISRRAAVTRVMLLVVALLGSVVAWVRAAPEPDPVPRRWQLDLEVGPLRIATVDAPGVGPRSYYYLTYKVTNSSSEDLLLAPIFEMAGEDVPVMRAGRGVPADVTRQLLERLGNPFLQDQISILGMILRGEENAKEGLVVWPADNLRARDLSIYAMGFSGETRPIEVADAKSGQMRKVLLRKTMMVRYDVPGDLDGHDSSALPVNESRWILR